MRACAASSISAVTRVRVRRKVGFARAPPLHLSLNPLQSLHAFLVFVAIPVLHAVTIALLFWSFHLRARHLRGGGPVAERLMVYCTGQLGFGFGLAIASEHTWGLGQPTRFRLGPSTVFVDA